MASDIDRSSLADVTTVVSELVTISVAHGASRPIEISLEVDDGRLDGSVWDEGHAARAMARAQSREDSTLVLRIVEGLVDEWRADDAEKRFIFRMSVQRV